jgi:CheY-like chemotaxis protein
MAGTQERMGRELDGLSILVVEDEIVIALDTAFAIEAAGGTVVGPAHSVDEAFERIAGGHIDAALLDITLRNQKVFGLADALADRNVPIVFVTGEIWPTIPERHAACRRVGKPIAHANVIRSLRDAIGTAQSDGHDTTAGPLATDR